MGANANTDALPTKKDELHNRYEKLASTRDLYLARARDCSLLTLPQIYPPSDFGSGSDFYKPYQSIGARGVNNLANKLLLSLFPPNTPFFKLAVDDKTVTELSGDDKARSKVEEKLNEIERAVQTKMETSNYRAPLVAALKMLIVGGNVLLLFTENSRMRVLRLDRYVVRRNSEGEVVEVIIKEMVDRDELPDDVKLALGSSDLPSDNIDLTSTKDIPVYTTYVLKGDRFITYQTVQGVEVDGTRGSYPKKTAPFIALRWSYEDGEDYGRGYVEEYIGDLQSAEGLSKAIIESSAAAAKVVILVNPNGQTSEDDIARSENLDTITGREEDVSMLHLQRQGNMIVAKDVLNDVLQRLSFAFLMNTAVQRNAERVTAEEIREMVKELEDALGGTYALLAQEFQLPFVKIEMQGLVKAGRIPDLSSLETSGVKVEPTITTGIEAIGRGHDLTKLQTFMSVFVAPFGELGLAELNVPDFLKRAGVSLGIDMDGLVKSEEQRQAEAAQQQQMQQNATMNQMAMDGVRAAAPVVAKAVTGQ